MITKYREGSISSEIINVIFITGELPHRALRFMGSSSNASMRAARRMRDAEDVSFDYAVPGVRTIVLNKECQHEPFWGAKERHEKVRARIYFKDKSKETKMKRLRCINMSMVVALMQSSNVSILPTKKPELNKELFDEANSCYYDIREVKEMLSLGTLKASSGRGTGLMINNGCVGMVYSVFKGDDIKCNRKAEITTRDKIESVIANSLTDKTRKMGYRSFIEDAYICAGDLRMLESLVIKNLIVNGKPKKESSFILDKSLYYHYYYLTYDREGVALLKMMQEKDGIKKLLALPITNENAERTKGSHVVCDGITSEGVYQLNFLVPDVLKLKQFIHSVEVNQRLASTESRETDKYELYCFDYHSSIVRRAVKGLNVEVVPFKTDTVLKAFYGKGE
ncbi:hypothetical protein M2146_001046 [Lachnospiraceae bacterium PF1-22]